MLVGRGYEARKGGSERVDLVGCGDSYRAAEPWPTRLPDVGHEYGSWRPSVGRGLI